MEEAEVTADDGATMIVTRRDLYLVLALASLLTSVKQPETARTAHLGPKAEALAKRMKEALGPYTPRTDTDVTR